MTRSPLEAKQHEGDDGPVDHAPTRFGGPVDEEDFLADRQRFWFSWMKFVVGVACAVIVLLILMTVFLV